MSIKAIIVDDERLARKELRHLLGQSGFEVDIVAEAANVDEALEAIENKPVDVVFLDIQMPGKNGFELLEMLTTCPDIIFTTAFDQYALDAFNANALDYLLKPIETERLEKSLEKLCIEQSRQPQHLLQQRLGIHDKVFIKDGEKCFFLPVDEVIAFSSIGNYSRVISKQGEPLIRKTLNQLEQRLPQEQFFRVNRQYIINLKMVKDVDVAMSGNLEATLCNGLTLEMSRRQSGLFKEKMSF